MFKLRLTADEFNALPEGHKVIYVKDGDGYKLPLHSDDDPTALLNAKNRERDLAKERQTKIEELNREVARLNDTISTNGGNTAAIEASWTAKFTARENELTAQAETLRGRLNNTLVDVATSKLAAEMTGKPEDATIIFPHIRNRFDVVWENNEPVVKIKDNAGKLSALTPDELKQEFVKNPTFATLVVASRASGAGAAGSSSSSSGGAGKKFKDMSEPEKVALYRENPGEYKRLRDAQ